VELFIIRWELLIFFGEMSRVLLQSHKLVRLWAWYRAPNSWDTTGRSQVFNHSVGESVHSISIRSTRRSCLHQQFQIESRAGWRIILVSLSQPTIVCLLKNKNKIIKFNSRK
jgi:hypothetical protein